MQQRNRWVSSLQNYTKFREGKLRPFLALTVVMVPVVAHVATTWGMNPLQLVVPVTMASSCAFMLPMATPPNAIVFGSGQLRMATMVRVGVVLNVVAALLAWVWATWVLPSWMQLL